MSSGLTKEDVENNYEDVFKSAENGTFKDHGTIVLTHEITGDTMDVFMDMYGKIKDNFKYIVPFYAAENKTNLYVESGDDVKQGQTFAEYVKDIYNGTSVEAATSTNSNSHPEPTVTGTKGAFATIANPTVASVEGAAASDITNESDNDNDNDSAATSSTYVPLISVIALIGITSVLSL